MCVYIYVCIYIYIRIYTLLILKVFPLAKHVEVCIFIIDPEHHSV